MDGFVAFRSSIVFSTSSPKLRAAVEAMVAKSLRNSR